MELVTPGGGSLLRSQNDQGNRIQTLAKRKVFGKLVVSVCPILSGQRDEIVG